MRRFAMALILAVGLALGLANAGTAQAAVAGPSGQLSTAAGMLSAVEKTDFIFRGRAHCWYNSGWHGPGWYWCGYRWRRGLGWGGPRGWNNWVWGGWSVVPVVPAPRCRWVRERRVRPDGVVVIRRVRVCR